MQLYFQKKRPEPAQQPQSPPSNINLRHIPADLQGLLACIVSDQPHVDVAHFIINHPILDELVFKATETDVFEHFGNLSKDRTSIFRNSSLDSMCSYTPTKALKFTHPRMQRLIDAGMRLRLKARNTIRDSGWYEPRRADIFCRILNSANKDMILYQAVQSCLVWDGHCPKTSYEDTSLIGSTLTYSGTLSVNSTLGSDHFLFLKTFTDVKSFALILQEPHDPFNIADVDELAFPAALRLYNKTNLYCDANWTGRPALAADLLSLPELKLIHPPHLWCCAALCIFLRVVVRTLLIQKT